MTCSIFDADVFRLPVTRHYLRGTGLQSNISKCATIGKGTARDLRAIPWVFAWSQNRHLITGWYGFGSAINSFRKVRGQDGEQLLLRMFSDRPLFRLVVDEVGKLETQRTQRRTST